jgi:hypothetical protein
MGGTAYQVQVSPQDSGLWKLEQSEQAADKVTELLQRDLEVSINSSDYDQAMLTKLQEHHVFFNKDGFHNHVCSLSLHSSRV